MRDRNLGAVCDDYLARARRHLPIEVVEVDDDAALLRRIPAGADVIALEAGGEAWDTAKLTAYVEESMVHGRKTVVFLIGGSDGLPKAAVGSGRPASVAVGDDAAASPGPGHLVRTDLPRAVDHQGRAIQPLTPGCCWGGGVGALRGGLEFGFLRPPRWGPGRNR